MTGSMTTDRNGATATPLMDRPDASRTAINATYKRKNGAVATNIDGKPRTVVKLKIRKPPNQAAQSTPKASSGPTPVNTESKPGRKRKPLPSETEPAPINRPELEDDGYDLPSLGASTFQIYAWPCPRPTDFPNLSTSRLDWKTRTDAAKKLADFDDGADDWEDFAGNAAYYDSPAAMASAVARTFVNRAKRALWANKTWTGFVRAQMAIDSEKLAKQERDPARRKILMEEALENKLCMAIFWRVAERLCNEIWLEEFPGRVQRSSREAKESGGNAGTPTRDLGDDDGEPTGHGTNPIDHTQERQPIYASESVVPNGTWGPLVASREEANARMTATTILQSGAGGAVQAPTMGLHPNHQQGAFVGRRVFSGIDVQYGRLR